MGVKNYRNKVEITTQRKTNQIQQEYPTAVPLNHQVHVCGTAVWYSSCIRLVFFCVVISTVPCVCAFFTSVNTSKVFSYRKLFPLVLSTGGHFECYPSLHIRNVHVYMYYIHVHVHVYVPYTVLSKSFPICTL